MTRYRAYGLILDCGRELPFAAADAGIAADVTILDALGQAPAAPSAELFRELRRDGAAGWSLRYRNPEGGWLHFDHDAEAKTLAVAGSVCWSDAVPVLAGVACGVLLSSAGTPLLHGAAVAFEGGAVGLLGDSGHGKSTLAGALLKAGGRLLSEDLLAFTRSGSNFAVEPGYSRISLLPDSRHALGFDGLEGGAVQPRKGTAKCWISAAAATEPAAIRRLYILAPPDPAAPGGRAQRLSRSAAAPALVRQLYGALWIRPVSEADLAFCGSLAAEIPVFTLSRPASLGLAEACAATLRSGGDLG
jgi:hypothetical protein